MADVKDIKKNTKLRIILAVFAGIVLLLFLGNHARKEYIYRAAQEWISQGDYSKASDILKGIEGKNFKDADALIRLCCAHESYDDGHITDAWYWVKYMPGGFQSETQQNEYQEFKNQVEEEYDAYMDAQVERELREYENKVRNGVPFVGMSEYQISKTSLGAPSSNVRHNNATINGKIYRANLYDFYNGDTIIFTARCVQGKVTEVWDSRDNPIVKKTISTKKATKDESDDPYNAKDYSHAEDFYDDHYDDFLDYYDAEDYWNDHRE